MEKNKENKSKTKLTDDFLDQVVGGTSPISVSDVKEWKMARVVNLICYTTDSILYMSTSSSRSTFMIRLRAPMWLVMYVGSPDMM